MSTPENILEFMVMVTQLGWVNDMAGELKGSFLSEGEGNSPRTKDFPEQEPQLHSGTGSPFINGALLPPSANCHKQQEMRRQDRKAL